MAARGGVGTLVLTHFREKSPALMRSVEADVRKDYAGRLVPGEDMPEIEVRGA